MHKKSVSAKLKHPIAFLRLDIKANLASSWEICAHAYAGIMHMFDNQVQNSQQFNFGYAITENYYLFHIRYIPAIEDNMRIMLNSRLFEIKRVININESNQFLKIIALEITTEEEDVS